MTVVLLTMQSGAWVVSQVTCLQRLTSAFTPEARQRTHVAQGHVCAASFLHLCAKHVCAQVICAK